MKFLLLIFLLPLTLLAQKNEALPKDLAGAWTGYMYNDTTQLRNDFELAISENNRKLSGYTYTIFLIDGKKNIGVKSVKIRTRKDLLLIEDEKLIDDNYDDRPAKGVRTFIELHYTQNDTADLLTGSWKTNITREYNSVTGNIFLARKKEPEETAIIPKLRQLNLLDQLSFVPSEGLSSMKNDVAGRQSSVSENIHSAQRKVVNENEKNSVGIVKIETKATETEKIVPDTTITNEEITIYMFPKNDVGSKDSAISGVEKNGLAANQEKTGVKKDTLVSLAVKNEPEKLLQGTDARRVTVSNNARPETAGSNDTGKNPTTLKALIAKNKTVIATAKKQNVDSIVLDTRNNQVVLNNSSGNQQINGILSKNKQEGISAKVRETTAKVATPKLITEEMLRAREIETIRTVEIEMDTLIFSLFDNGVIDGDTVSVLLNGEVIMSKIGLLAKAYNDTIYLTPDMGDSIHIILYAENLGSIPPNTGLLVVREGAVDHEIRFSGDLKKNSAVILKRKKHINGK